MISEQKLFAGRQLFPESLRETQSNYKPILNFIPEIDRFLFTFKTRWKHFSKEVF